MPASPIDDLASYALRVAGRDRSWMEHGLCRSSRHVPAEYYTVPEQHTVTIVVAEGQVLTTKQISGTEAQRLAAEQCAGCPVQWECARWAVEVEEEAGVWAIPTRLMVWFRNNHPNPLGVIDTARVHGTPVAEAVRVARRDLAAARKNE